MALGNNLFQVTTASGPANFGVPGDTSYGIIQQGYLEAPTSIRFRRSPT